MRKTLIILSFVLLSSCEKIPYFPEPFGNVNYEYSEKKGRVILSNEDQSLNTNSSLHTSIRNNPNPIIDTHSIQRYRATQDYYLAQFASMNEFAYAASINDSQALIVRPASSTANNPSDCDQNIKCVSLSQSDWKEVALNGANYVDAVCQDYLRQIYRLQKNTDGLKNLNNKVGDAVEAVVGFASPEAAATTRAINIIGAAFGLSSSVFDIYRNSVLINIDFRSLHSLVKRYQLALITERATIDSRSKAVKFIQDYLYLCSPPAIEAAINAKVAGELTDEEKEAAGISEKPKS